MKAGPAQPLSSAAIARTGSPAELRQALADTRARTLAMVTAWRAQLGDALPMPYAACLNPVRWELGHIGWFEERWLARNAHERHHGHDANPDAPLQPSLRPQADTWYDSSRVEHRSRWTLPLPAIDAIVDDVHAQREATLRLLDHAQADDPSLYFHRLVLAHEDMHAEAWVMMAQHLGIDPGDALAERAMPMHPRHHELVVTVCTVDLGAHPSQQGFAFDNELGSCRVAVDGFRIDATVVTWARFMPFVEEGGYRHAAWWDAAGWAWCTQHGLHHPRVLREGPGGGWQQRVFSRWRDVHANEPAVHLTAHEARAWCRWAGRSLPTEAQWRAAQAAHDEFAWGNVWEWTASSFEPFEGFRAHPYRDYSKPWFDGRPVLKGASRWTHPHMVDPRYRNFFAPHRDDVAAGFRSVAALQ